MLQPLSKNSIAAVLALGASLALGACDVGGDASERSAGIARIQRQLEGALGDEVTGIQLGLVHPEWGPVALAAGHANIATKEAMTPSHLTRIASATKLFTATAVMKLVEDGRLALDETLDELLPELSVPNGELITVELLLRHRAGLADHFNDSEAFQDAVLEAPETVWTPEELVDAALALGAPEKEDIDAGFGYTNTAYVLLGLVIEVVTSETYEDFVAAQVIEPAGLEATQFANRIDDLEGYAEGYWFPTPEPVPCSGYDASFVWSAGSLVSTAAELAAFIDALFDGKILSPSTLSEMCDFVEIDDGMRFGLGLLDIPGVGTGHNGAIFGYTSHVLYNAKRDLAAAVIINSLSDESDPLAVIVNVIETLDP